MCIVECMTQSTRLVALTAFNGKCRYIIYIRKLKKTKIKYRDTIFLITSTTTIV